MERTVTIRSELEAILVEQALALARELQAGTDAAPDGQVLAIAELAAGPPRPRADPRRVAGRTAASGRPVREKGAPGRACPCGGRRRVKDKASRITVTAAGRVELARRSPVCTGCGTAAYPADDRVGLAGFLSPHATRLACTAAASWSFGLASARLAEFAGVVIDDETIRRHCHRAASALARRREEAAPEADFAAAAGDAEFLTDGVMIPTRSGWREAKMAMFQLRPRGEPAEPEAWASRDRPGPTASVAYAAVADCESFSARWGPWAKALGIDPAGELTVLGDGAAWIRGAAAVHFPGATRVLDIFHAGRHIAAAANAVHGEGTAAAADWLEKGRRCLLADGWEGLCDHAGATPSGELTAAGRAGVEKMVGYFAGHGPAGRLHAAAVGPVDRQRGGGGAGQAAGAAAEGAGPRVVRGERGRDGGLGGVDRHAGVGGTLGKARRLITRIESYTPLHRLTGNNLATDLATWSQRGYSVPARRQSIQIFIQEAT